MCPVRPEGCPAANSEQGWTSYGWTTLRGCVRDMAHHRNGELDDGRNWKSPSEHLHPVLGAPGLSARAEAPAVPDGAAGLPPSPHHGFPHASRKSASRFDRLAGFVTDTAHPPGSRTSRRLDVSVWESMGKAVRRGVSRVRYSSSGTWASQSPGNLVNPDALRVSDRSWGAWKQVRRQFRPAGRDFQVQDFQPRGAGRTGRPDPHPAM